MTSYIHLNALSALLQTLPGSAGSIITFRESHDSDELYAKYVESDDQNLLESVAKALGCPADQMEEGSIMCGSGWRGDIDARHLFDELSCVYGLFNELPCAVAELIRTAQELSRDPLDKKVREWLLARQGTVFSAMTELMLSFLRSPDTLEDAALHALSRIGTKDFMEETDEN